MERRLLPARAEICWLKKKKKKLINLKIERKYCPARSEIYCSRDCSIEEIKLNAQINIFALLLKSSDEKSSSDENSSPMKKYV